MFLVKKINRTDKQNLYIKLSCYFPYYINSFSNYLSQSCQNFLKLFSYTHFISTSWMALNDLISGFQITRELITSIQILEKDFLDIWEFL